MAKGDKGNILSRLKLNKKFLLMYILCVILPLVITDAILFKSVFDAERRNQTFYRERGIEAYTNYLDDLLSSDAAIATAIDVNDNLNKFINTGYQIPYDYYKSYVNTVSNSFFSTMSDMNQKRLVIYSDNQTMLSGHYFHNLAEAKRERWYIDFIENGKLEAVYAYYDNAPVVLTTDQDRFIYVRRMTNTRSSITKIITIEHKKSWIATEMNDIPVNCSMYVCCDDYVIYSNQNINADYDSLLQKVNA